MPKAREQPRHAWIDCDGCGRRTHVAVTGIPASVTFRILVPRDGWLLCDCPKETD